MTPPTPPHNYVRLELHDDPYEVVVAAAEGERVRVRSDARGHHIQTLTLSSTSGEWVTTKEQTYAPGQVVRVELRS